MTRDPTRPEPWYEWGPYLAERAWGTVREDYSADGNAWASFPYEQAVSRTYRWNEDGMAGLSDLRQDICLGLSLWNGEDDHLKERMFGLAGPQGNHGEDAKEAWWYTDALPSQAWLSWRYHYPQSAFPYQALIDENARRDRSQPEYEIFDTAAFDDNRFWKVEVDYAKASPTDINMRIRVTNEGPEARNLHVLPSIWFRNTWERGRKSAKPRLWHSPSSSGSGSISAQHWRAGVYHLQAGPDSRDRAPVPIFCENTSNQAALWDGENLSHIALWSTFVVQDTQEPPVRAFDPRSGLRHQL